MEILVIIQKSLVLSIQLAHVTNTAFLQFLDEELSKIVLFIYIYICMISLDKDYKNCHSLGALLENFISISYRIRNTYINYLMASIFLFLILLYLI